jgi:hypothetical protein
MHTRAQAFRSHGADIALDYAADRNGREVAQPVRQVADIMSISFIADCRLEAPRSGSVIPPQAAVSLSTASRPRSTRHAGLPVTQGAAPLAGTPGGCLRP